MLKPIKETLSANGLPVLSLDCVKVYENGAQERPHQSNGSGNPYKVWK